MRISCIAQGSPSLEENHHPRTHIFCLTNAAHTNMYMYVVFEYIYTCDSQSWLCIRITSGNDWVLIELAILLEQMVPKSHGLLQWRLSSHSQHVFIVGHPWPCSLLCSLWHQGDRVASSWNTTGCHGGEKREPGKVSAGSCHQYLVSLARASHVAQVKGGLREVWFSPASHSESLSIIMPSLTGMFKCCTFLDRLQIY